MAGVAELADAQDLGSCTARCRGSTPLSCIVLWMMCLIAPAAARGDTIWVGENAANPIQADGVTILRLEGDHIVYDTPGGSEVSKPLTQVQRIAVDDEPAFNAAEEAYVEGKWDTAADQYQAALHGTGRDWVKQRCSVRLAEVAGKANRFDAAVGAYIALLTSNPAAAAVVRPTVTGANPALLDAGAAEISVALEANTLSDAQRTSLLRLALEIYRARNQTAGINATLKALVNIGAATPADMAIVKLLSAQSALDTKDFKTAQNEIQQNRALFTDPSGQIDALWISAQAQDGLTDRSDATALKDAAIAYMRVATFGKDVSDKPHVAEALLHAAAIEQELKEPAAAMELYRRIEADFPGQPAAATAKSARQRLSQGP
jgi:tetratricopeptide (TPR) repeat protein